MKLTGRNAYIARSALDATGGMVDEAMTPAERGRAIAYGLYEYIRLQQSLPESERKGSDEQDAKALLIEVFPDALRVFIEADRKAGRTPPDLFDEKAEHGRS